MPNSTAKPRRLADGAELDAFVADNDLALVEFYTKGCSLCQAMEPVLGNVARELSQRDESPTVAVGMVNPGNDIDLVDRFDIRSVPTLVLFRDGVEVARQAEGFQGANDVVTFLESNTEVTLA